MRGRTERRGPVGDDGFTLVELILAVLIIGIITVPLGNVVIGFLRNTDATTARLLASHDAQIASTYWAQDVASIGTRSATSPYLFTQSVEKNVLFSSSLFPCGPAGTTPIGSLAWDDFSVDPVTKAVTTTLVRVAYLVVPTASGPMELHRLRCNGSAAVVSDVILAHDLDPRTMPVLTCATPTTCTTAAVPMTLSLALTLKDPGSVGGTYVVPLTGQRRQS